MSCVLLSSHGPLAVSHFIYAIVLVVVVEPRPSRGISDTLVLPVCPEDTAADIGFDFMYCFERRLLSSSRHRQRQQRSHSSRTGFCLRPNMMKTKNPWSELKMRKRMLKRKRAPPMARKPNTQVSPRRTVKATRSISRCQVSLRFLSVELFAEIVHRPQVRRYVTRIKMMVLMRTMMAMGRRTE